MARANTVTWLSLDEFAAILGINPLAFNGLASNRFNNITCGDIFFQYDWQHSDRIGRDTIAQAIQQAEMEISAEAGFNLMPAWTEGERIEYPQPAVPGGYGVGGLNPRGMWKSVEARRGYLISGGVRTKTLIEAGAAIVRTDADGDGYAETCTVTIATSLTDINDIRIYYPGEGGADEWEIRPAKVTLSGGNAVIVFKAWQVPDADQLERLDADPLDGDAAASYETTVDVYRVYNDPSTQLQFIWENVPYMTDSCCGSCVACQLGTQAGCFHLRDTRLGMVVPVPASWNAGSQSFDATEWSVCREPDQVRLWYVSGYIDQRVARPYVELSPYWKAAVAYFAASKFDRPVCGCSNVAQFIDKWRRDAAFSSQEEGGFSVTAEMMSNKLGTTMGALYAYRQIHRNGMRIRK